MKYKVENFFKYNLIKFNILSNCGITQLEYIFIHK